MKTLIATLLIVALVATTRTADAQANAPGDALAVAEKLNAAYIAAFNKGDARELAAMYAENAEYVDGSGERINGRAAVEQGLSEFLAANKGSQLEAVIDSARYLTPDVLVEK